MCCSYTHSQSYSQNIGKKSQNVPRLDPDYCLPSLRRSALVIKVSGILASSSESRASHSKAEGRVLSAPKLFDEVDGVFPFLSLRADVEKSFEPAKIEYWAVVNFSARDDNVRALINQADIQIWHCFNDLSQRALRVQCQFHQLLFPMVFGISSPAFSLVDVRDNLSRHLKKGDDGGDETAVFLASHLIVVQEMLMRARYVRLRSFQVSPHP
ncbi:hypothetical protein OIU76_021531 [Salix suchowensis]|nr:hypothetical protein OIU76_021531 [Salix suchowensis]